MIVCPFYLVAAMAYHCAVVARRGGVYAITARLCVKAMFSRTEPLGHCGGEAPYAIGAPPK